MTKEERKGLVVGDVVRCVDDNGGESCCLTEFDYVIEGHEYGFPYFFCHYTGRRDDRHPIERLDKFEVVSQARPW